jgi:23S rRNA pseudouridine1911/1915/1917 synthase
VTAPEPPVLRLDVPARLAGVRFDRALAELVDCRTRAQLQKLVRRGRVEVNDRRVLRSNFALSGGERVLVRLADADEAPELRWLHVEDAFAVVDKPPGMLTHPTERHAGGTVAELAVERLGDLPSTDDAYRPGIVHRLDRETSGVLVIGRDPAAFAHLRGQFRRRSVEKVYLALVHGDPAEDRFEVDRPLAPVPSQRDLQRVDPGGRPARTAFRVLERWGATALVECLPATGRRHQIRVHLADAGHPIVGDKLYRPEERVERVAAPHHALHAARLAFDHPQSGERPTFEAPLPASMQALLGGTP